MVPKQNTIDSLALWERLEPPGSGEGVPRRNEQTLARCGTLGPLPSGPYSRGTVGVDERSGTPVATGPEQAS